MPVLGNDDWVELLASPKLASYGSSLRNSGNAGNGNVTGKTPFFAGKDAYKNRVSNTELSTSVASKHAPPNSYNSIFSQSACHSDGLALSVSLDSNKFVRHDNNSETNSICKGDGYIIQNETPATRGKSFSIIKCTNNHK